MTKRMKFDKSVDAKTVEAEYKENIRAMAEAQKKSVETGRKMFGAKVREFFDTHTVAETASWSQYTPYFNDGDTCIFRVGAGGVSVNGFDPYEPMDVDAATKVNLETAINAFQKVLHSFSEATLEELFGDHVRVTVTPTGARSEQYDHD